jgi:hypothetical protein
MKTLGTIALSTLLPVVMVGFSQVVIPQVKPLMIINTGESSTSSSVSGGTCVRTAGVIVIPLTTARHPAIIAHARLAVRRGYPRVMVLNRVGAAERRRAALRGVVTRRGYDRDEYPAAIGRARGVWRADVAYVLSGENRSAGAIMGNRLRGYCGGVKFRYAGV